MTARPDHDLFDRDAFGLPAIGGPVPDAVLAGLAKLAGCPPLWAGEVEWLELVDRLRAWAYRWHAPATAAGWLQVQLYGLDPVAPRARVARMGAAFLACAPGRQVLSVDGEAIRIVTRTAARLSVYRPAEGAVLAWELVKAPAGAQVHQM